MSIQYSIITDGDASVVTVLDQGTPRIADSTHPNFQKIVAGCIANDPEVVNLFDVANTVKQSFESLSERVAVSNGRVYFDGDEVDNSISRQILRFIEAGLEPTAMVAFMENVAQNPNEHSREQLFSWLNGKDFTITTDGHFVAYKGVRPDGDLFRSIHAGPAVVNGESVSGNVPQAVGDVVTMPRSNVAFDPAEGCSTGLHAGTWDYARDFSQGAVLTVKINPRDVVSVPTDCDSQKLRVCRYEVINVTETEYLTPLFDDDEDEDDEMNDVVEMTYNLRHEFNSTLLDRAWYDTESQTAYIKFVDSGSIYWYSIDPETWDSFVVAVSPGRFFNQHIKYAPSGYVDEVEFLSLV